MSNVTLFQVIFLIILKLNLNNEKPDNLDKDDFE